VIGEPDTRFASAWVDGLLSAVDATTDPQARRAVFQECSRMCTEYWAAQAGAVRESHSDASDAELLSAFSAVLPGGAGPKLTGGLIQWRFTGEACPCPLGRLVTSPALCECSVEHVRGMLEPLLGRPVEVRLLGSRRRGADDCLFEAR
jgi:hypothetical protein